MPVDGSNESFLVNGSLSQGLQTQAGDLRQDFGWTGRRARWTQWAHREATQPKDPARVACRLAAHLAAAVDPEAGVALAEAVVSVGWRLWRRPRRRRIWRRAGRTWRTPRDRNGNPAFIGNRRPNNNRITGSVFYRVGNSAIDARPFSVNGLLEPKAAYAQNYFGFSAGGPLFIPKLFNAEKVFWFINYNGTRLRNGVDQSYTVPTAAERSGNFAGIPGVQLFAPQSGGCSGCLRQYDSDQLHQPAGATDAAIYSSAQSAGPYAELPFGRVESEQHRESQHPGEYQRDAKRYARRHV